MFNYKEEGEKQLNNKMELFSEERNKGDIFLLIFFNFVNIRIFLVRIKKKTLC